MHAEKPILTGKTGDDYIVPPECSWGAGIQFDQQTVTVYSKQNKMQAWCGDGVSVVWVSFCGGICLLSKFERGFVGIFFIFSYERSDESLPAETLRQDKLLNLVNQISNFLFVLQASSQNQCMLFNNKFSLKLSHDMLTLTVCRQSTVLTRNITASWLLNSMSLDRTRGVAI